MLRVDGVYALRTYAADLLTYIPVALLVRLLIFYWYGLYNRYWRYASVQELVQIVWAVGVSSLAVVALFFAVRLPALGLCQAWPSACGLPRSIPFIDSLLVLLSVGAVRFSIRSVELWRYRARLGEGTRRVLIVGAGDAGTHIAREMRHNPQLGMDPLGFVDDDPAKQGTRIHGILVLGGRQDIPRLVEEHPIAQVVIAMPTAPGKVIREVLEVCEAVGVPARTMPGTYELLDGRVSVNQLRPVEIEDLLRREPVETDFAAVQELIRGRRVLVTGAGGSIGSELCRQVLRCDPAQLVLLGHGENSIFDIHSELVHQTMRRRARSKPQRNGSGVEMVPSSTRAARPCIVPVLADVRNADRIRAIFQQYRPHIVFHAAAHKHVPLMEQNPAEAITNNVWGTQCVVQAALASGVERFVLISTDKAVNPTSVMGASKRVAELIVLQAARQTGRPYVAVRFGNVLGSRGSVVHTFRQQIAAGGPVTVTHPDMQRFFMTIPEAVQLVLQAATMGAGGEIFVLDMGKPVKILDLARDMIELSGLEVGRDIDIVFTGLRPGEKLYEELFVAGEQYTQTQHAKIFIAANAGQFIPHDLDRAIEALVATATADNREGIRAALQALVPEYQPNAGWHSQPGRDTDSPASAASVPSSPTVAPI
ncbi:MAG: polysaccharide biosynthesis protein [Caldilineales bacterium]|nr:polysaccharide biosynthesis protein [Caldilineales bacterium]MDW8316810.1 nucleoside-diphosphate sugar epimerase/dehydratase [Anaerolineae bacterium]